jgi:hypothetical protein
MEGRQLNLDGGAGEQRNNVGFPKNPRKNDIGGGPKPPKALGISASAGKGDPQKQNK